MQTVVVEHFKFQSITVFDVIWFTLDSKSQFKFLRASVSTDIECSLFKKNEPTTGDVSAKSILDPVSREPYPSHSLSYSLKSRMCVRRLNSSTSSSDCYLHVCLCVCVCACVRVTEKNTRKYIEILNVWCSCRNHARLNLLVGKKNISLISLDRFTWLTKKSVAVIEPFLLSFTSIN